MSETQCTFLIGVINLKFEGLKYVWFAGLVWNKVITGCWNGVQQCGHRTFGRLY